MAKLKVIKHEVLNGRLLVTVEVDIWWKKPYTRQFIESGKVFEKSPNEDPAWYTYPEFTIVGWCGSNTSDVRFHELLTGWKKKYNFENNITNGK